VRSSAFSFEKAFSIGLREIEELCAGSLDRRAHACALMAAEILHDDDIACPQFWNENLIDIGLERAPVDRPIENHRCDHARQAQVGDEGRRLPVAVRDGGTQPLAARPRVRAILVDAMSRR
jgi:hypothetical protein